MGDIGTTSFFPSKNLGCYGDGGAIFTDDDELTEKLISIRIHGKGSGKYDNFRVGLNARMDTLQAAILLPKLEIFREELEARQQVAHAYTEQFTKNITPCTVPYIPNGYKSAWAQYSILSDKREEIMAHLHKNGIPSVIYYPKPLHLQTAFRSLSFRTGDFPTSESVSKQIFSLPMHPYLDDELVCRIARFIRLAYELYLKSGH
jgi:UDP-2-acetamido-2-deoxy-ribo-hexuluronate aminotransferase